MLCLSDADKEADKLEEYYKPQQTVIVKTGNDTNKQKEFLGYEFQGKKGSEGIKISNYGGKLFDPKDYNNPQKANSYIRNHILDNTIYNIDEDLKENVNIYRLIDLLNFEKVEFEKIIKTYSAKKYTIQTKWDLIKIENILINLITGNRPKGGISTYNNGVLSLGGEHIGKDGNVNLTNKKYVPTDYADKISYAFIKKNDILICKDGALSGKVAFVYNQIKAVINEHLYILRTNANQKYVFSFLNSNLGQTVLRNNVTGAAVGGINSTNLKNIKIPIPSKEIQQKIVSEIEKIEQKETKGLEKIKELEQEIQTEFKQAVSGKKKVKLDKICISQSGGTPSRKVPEYWENGTINWLRSEVCQNCYVYEKDVKEKITELGLKKSSAKLFKKDTVLIALVGATIGRVAYLTFEATTNQNIAGLYPKDEKELNSKFLFYALMNDFDKNFGDRKGKFTMANMSLIRNLAIGLPKITEQKKLISIIEKKEKEIDKIKLSLENIKTEKEEVLIKYL